MLYIILKDETEFHWHVGEFLKRIQNIQDVVEIQADGDELDWVTINISNIPMWNKDSSSRRVISWFGDHAKFITNCIPLKY